MALYASVGRNLVAEENLVTFAIDSALLMSEEEEFEFPMAHSVEKREKRGG